MSLSDFFAEQSGLDDREKAYAQHLAYGVLRWLPALNWLSRQLLDKPLKNKDDDIQRLVMTGIFQLWLDSTADHAAVHATAECAREVRKPWAVGLINALLRRFQREKEELLAGLATVPEQHAHPKWLTKAIQEDWPENWQKILRENNQQAPLWLRVNTAKTDVSSWCKNLESPHTSNTTPRAPDAVSISPALPVKEIPGFNEGQVSVQDPAAQLAAAFLDPQPGDRVLDACAAPGGKTCHLLEQHSDIELLALDRSAERLKMVRENLDRLGLDCTLKAVDAMDTDSWWDGQAFDKILLDAPCSTTGVIRRHPEIKWLRDPDQVKNAVTAQHDLLEQLWPLLRTGGILVYATCSILKCENHQQIHGFLSRHNNAALVSPGSGSCDSALPGFQILPGEDQMDGFYYAVISKSA